VLHAQPKAALALFVLLGACVPPHDDSPADDPDVTVPSVTELPLAICDDPVGAPGRFDDGNPGSGVDFLHVIIPPVFDNTPEDDDPFNGAFGGGVVAADLDGDGAADLFFAQEDGANQLYWGQGNGTFEPASDATAGTIGLADSRTFYVNTADYDGDGRLDLLVAGFESLHLFRNQGDRSFLEVATTVGLAPVPGYPGGLAWGDYDQDGDLDLFVGSYGLVETGPDANTNGPDVVASSLYRNDGALFSDQTSNLPIVSDEEGACLQAAFRDLDDDGDLDLLQVNDFGPWRGMTNFWENGGATEGAWSWVDRHPDSGVGQLRYPMGSLFRDLDGDQHPDLWFSNIGATRALQSVGPWQWVDVRVAWATEVVETSSDISWSVVDIDLYGDGRPSVYINFGPHIGAEPPPDWGENYVPNQPDRFLVNDADLGSQPDFRLAPEVFPHEQTGNARGTAIADLDNNGVPDLVTSNLDSAPSILLGRCTTSRRLVVSLRDPLSSNRFGIGAKVTVEAGALMQTQEISAGGRGSFSGSEPQLFFGLGEADRVDRLQVRWPDGIVESFEGLCGHCQVTITRATDSTD